ncbi:hypothetical protein UFOVP434_22 [uncultured Caudovirales phage]|uniref:Uncharacterized protein n=1 Tax=uncultured Caudovirales phage TaxID=2100421 RepID=A0A6J5M787_9CAUD|nr:hypothetical protein UFOVP434_22 [uncultured Caudovirales phage]
MDANLITLQKGPLGKWYSTGEIDEMWDFLNLAFRHYECYDPRLKLSENISRLIGVHMQDAMETESQRILNINSWFYGKETFRLGDLQIDTRRE